MAHPRRQRLSLVRRHVVFDLIRSEFSETACTAFLRVVVDGAAPKDVADELQISVNSVYLAKSRILRRVRDELGDVFA